MLGDAQLGDKFLKGVIGKLSTIVGDYRLWIAESREYIYFVEVKDVLGGNFGHSSSFYPFCEVVDRYDQIFILIGPYHKWAEEVQSPPGKGPKRGERLEVVRWS